jgi:hypothetical protein
MTHNQSSTSLYQKHYISFNMKEKGKYKKHVWFCEGKSKCEKSCYTQMGYPSHAFDYK